MDSWDGERLTISVDGTAVSIFSKGAYDGTQLCGNSAFEEEWFTLDWNGIHTGSNLVLKISSNLDEDATNGNINLKKIRIVGIQ